MKTLAFFILFINAQLLFAQQYYRLEIDSGTYMELVNATAIDTPDFANDRLTFLPLDGQTYNFFGLDFPMGGIKTFAVQTYGNLRVDNDSSTVIIDGLFGTLDSIDGNTLISYKLNVNAGDTVMKVQWKNVRLANGPTGNYANFQIWVYRESGIIELRYGPRSANNASGLTTGPYAGIFYSNDQFTQLYEKLWLSGDPNNITVDSSGVFAFNRLTGVPAEGTIWRLVPKNYQPPVSTEDIEQGSIEIYPNPVGDRLLLRGPLMTDVASIRVMDLSGVVRRTTTITGNAVDLSGLEGGIYLLEVHTLSGTVRKRVVKVEQE